MQSNRLLIPASSSDEDGELGFLDHMVEVEEGFGKLNEILDQINDCMNSLSTKTTETVAKMEAINVNTHHRSARDIQTFARTIAEFQTDYSRKLSVANTEYSSTLKNLETSLEYVISANDIHSEENRTQLSGLLEVLSGVEEASLAAKNGSLALAEMLDKSPKMEKKLTKSCQQTSKELKNFIDNIDQSIAMISRVRGIGERILRQSR
jgi:methyl-accepting chemotaxis protein